MHTRAACSHCMQERKSGFRFQNAEGQRHAAVVAEGKLRPQMVLVHPLGAAARKAVFRRAAFQPDGLYLTERKGACKAGAGRFEEGFLRGEICRRTGGFMGAEGERSFLRKPQRLPLRTWKCTRRCNVLWKWSRKTPDSKRSCRRCCRLCKTSSRKCDEIGRAHV